MTVLAGRTLGFGYLLHNHPWLLLLVLVVVIGVIVWMRRTGR
ncbi:hypothetical protein [Nocardioides flavescens]|nr:hypothetical protein [Nocardioides flavescens]